MPLFNFLCPKCNKTIKKLLKPEEAKIQFLCPDDNAILERNGQGPSTIIKEQLDNGLWIRKVEQYANAPDLVIEHEFNSDNLKKKNSL